MFKVGDKVYHFQYGWGEVVKPVFECDVLVRYETENLIGDNFQIQVVERMLRFDFLSFTEYTLQGFSQQRPIRLPEVGELCLVRDFKDSVWKARNFKKFTTHFLDDNGERWDEFKRIKILD
jgi:hypothetical protein